MQAGDTRERIGDEAEPDDIEEELRSLLTATGSRERLLSCFTSEELLDELFSRELT